MSGMMKVIIPIVVTAAAIALAPETGGASLAADAAITGGEEVGAASLESIIGATSAEAAAAGADMAATNAGISLAGVEAGTTSLGTSSWLASTASSVSPYLKGAALVAQVGGTLAQIAGAQQQGQGQVQLANTQAAQLTENANTSMATAEQAMIRQNQQTAYILSNAAAAAAAGGGSATDPTVTTNMSTIAGQGRLRALTDMYNGESSARASLNKAALTQYGGALASQAADTQTDTDILTGAGSLYTKYADLYGKNS